MMPWIDAEKDTVRAKNMLKANAAAQAFGADPVEALWPPGEKTARNLLVPKGKLDSPSNNSWRKMPHQASDSER